MGREVGVPPRSAPAMTGASRISAFEDVRAPRSRAETIKITRSTLSSSRRLIKELLGRLFGLMLLEVETYSMELPFCFFLFFRMNRINQGVCFEYVLL